MGPHQRQAKVQLRDVLMYCNLKHLIFLLLSVVGPEAK